MGVVFGHVALARAGGNNVGAACPAWYFLLRIGHEHAELNLLLLLRVTLHPYPPGLVAVGFGVAVDSLWILGEPQNVFPGAAGASFMAHRRGRGFVPHEFFWLPPAMFIE